MKQNWRAWVLLVLLVGPILAYVGLGTLWLFERGWLLFAGLVWFGSGIVFAALAARWTGSKRELLPPIDWDVPQTFAQSDRDAWVLVEEEAEQSETVPLESLTDFDLYITTGRRLAMKIAQHYRPLSADPIEHVPLVDMLTAMELAAEDLTHLCRQIPGGDMITTAFWKKAVQVAGYLQRANDIYSYLLPIFSPVNGLVRLGTQQWMVKPAWKNMQQNLLRWFFRAFVNRLGVHLIELYSGRLAIGADQYRRLTRRGARPLKGLHSDVPPLKIAVAGARHSGKSYFLARIHETRGTDLTILKAKLEGAGVDEAALEHLKTAQWIEIPGYTHTPGGESARDRASRREAVSEAVSADLLILVIDASADTTSADTEFARAWDRWYVEHPNVELPPALVVLSGIDNPQLGGDWKPPYNWEKGEGPREKAARDKLQMLRSALPPAFTEIVPVGIRSETPFGVVERFLPVLAAQFRRAERAALIHHLRRISEQSKARRLISQVGDQGRSLWSRIRAPRSPAQDHGKS
ncbi:MAG: hypothetical protein NVSMB9_06920 [Isosphaeraceae bacterium]